VGELAEAVSDPPLVLIGAGQVDHRGTLSRPMRHQRPQGRACVSRQGVSAVPEIMEVDGGQPGRNGNNAKMDLFAVGLIGILWQTHQHVSPL
jgi:hypothetical protein